MGRTIKKVPIKPPGPSILSKTPPCPHSLQPSTLSIKLPAVSSSGSHLGCDIAWNEQQDKIPPSPQGTRIPPLGPLESCVLPVEAHVPPKPLGPQKLVFFLWRLVFLLIHMDPGENPQVQRLALTSKILTKCTRPSLSSPPG